MSRLAVCVFCGSAFGRQARWTALAEEVGRELLRRDYALVYGGGRVGLMGVIADTVMAGGGEVIGILPRRLDQREVAHREITRLEIVDDMFQRKERMVELSSAFLVLPGGLGTCDELFEVVTLNQLDFHDKPTGVLNVGGFYDHLLAHWDRAEAEGFVGSRDESILVLNNVAEILDKLLSPAS